jgi:hypothetical protein
VAWCGLVENNKRQALDRPIGSVLGTFMLSDVAEVSVSQLLADVVRHCSVGFRRTSPRVSSGQVSDSRLLLSCEASSRASWFGSIRVRGKYRRLCLSQAYIDLADEVIGHIDYKSGRIRLIPLS